MAAQTLADLLTAALADDFATLQWQGVARQAILDGAGRLARTQFLPINEVDVVQNTTPLTDTYALPSMVRLRAIKFNGLPLDYVDKDTLDALGTTSNPTPRVFTVYGPNFIIRPVPTSIVALTLNILRTEGVISDGDPFASLSGIPEEYLGALVFYARSVLYGMTDDVDMSQFWEGKWNGMRLELKGTLAYRVQRRRRVVGISGSLDSGPVFRRP